VRELLPVGGACLGPGARVTLPSGMRLLAALAVMVVVGFLTLVGGLFVTPEWD
jgi:hypothetical protein